MSSQKKRLLAKQYDEFLDDLVDELFEMATAKDWTWADFARRASLSSTTVYRLGGRITRSPQIRTIWKLASALGCEVSVRSRIRRLKVA